MSDGPDVLLGSLQGAGMTIEPAPTSPHNDQLAKHNLCKSGYWDYRVWSGALVGKLSKDIPTVKPALIVVSTYYVRAKGYLRQLDGTILPGAH